MLRLIYIFVTVCVIYIALKKVGIDIPLIDDHIPYEYRAWIQKKLYESLQWLASFVQPKEV